MASNTVINTNVRALNSHRALGSVGASLERSSQRLSSGKKVNSAADDAAGLAITEKMRAQIKGLDMASKNAQDAMSLIQTVEGSASEIESMLQRIRELTVQAANDTNALDDRLKIASEIEQLTDEIDNMAERTEFNTLKPTSGSNWASMIDDDNADYEKCAKWFDPDIGGYFQIGANSSQYVKLITIPLSCRGMADTLTEDYQDEAYLDVDDNGNLNLVGNESPNLRHLGIAIAQCAEADNGEKISSYVDYVDKYISLISDFRANLGAVQNRLEYTNNNLQVSSENLSASKSRIEDADMASEMMNITSHNVLQQAATAMLAQANQSTSQVVQLLS